MIQEFYELSQKKDNGKGSQRIFSTSISTLSGRTMLLKINCDNVVQEIELQNEDLFVLLKLLRMPATSQVNQTKPIIR
tara:strand:- start:510 stop:743 length:234 start_codon:yes stop_codon:yes gene_type:complete